MLASFCCALKGVSNVPSSIDHVYSWFLIINVECDLQVFLPLVTMFLTLSFKLPPSINCGCTMIMVWACIYTVQCEACRVCYVYLSEVPCATGCIILGHDYHAEKQRHILYTMHA